MLFIPCRHQIFDQAGYRFDLDFSIQIFEQVGEHRKPRQSWIVDSGSQLLDSRSFSVEFGFRIPQAKIFKIPDSMGQKPPKIHPVRCERFARLRTSKNYNFDLTIHVGI